MDDGVYGSVSQWSMPQLTGGPGLPIEDNFFLGGGGHATQGNYAEAVGLCVLAGVLPICTGHPRKREKGHGFAASAMGHATTDGVQRGVGWG